MNIFEMYQPLPAVKPDHTNWECDHGVTIHGVGNTIDYCRKCKVEWDESERQVEETFVGKPYDPDTHGYYQVENN